MIAPIGLAGDLAAAWRAINEILDNRAGVQQGFVGRDEAGGDGTHPTAGAPTRPGDHRRREQHVRLVGVQEALLFVSLLAQAAQAINTFLAAMDANDVTARLHRFEQKYGSSGDRDKRTAVKLLSQVLDLGHEHSGKKTYRNAFQFFSTIAGLVMNIVNRDGRRRRHRTASRHLQLLGDHGVEARHQAR